MIKSVSVKEVHIGPSFDELAFSGRCGARVMPIGFREDIFFGGVCDQGITIRSGVLLSAPILLVPIPFGLNGLGGDYFHNS